jgi:predicted transcriptional regulator
MKAARIFKLGDLQMKIMRILWARGEAAVSDVHADLGKDLAYVTVATMLRRMEVQCLVKHRVDGRTFVYEAQVAEDAVTQGMVSDLVNRLFVGSVPALVKHLLSSRDVSREELAALEKLISERKRKS